MKLRGASTGAGQEATRPYIVGQSPMQSAPDSGQFVGEVIVLRDTALILLVRFGGDLLSHVLRRSTISAVALNGRVRDGIGCFAHAMTTKSNKQNQVPSQYGFGVWCMCFD